MGKFFDAMQRAAGKETAIDAEAPSAKSAVPELDDVFLQPEEPETPISDASATSSAPGSQLPEGFGETPSGVIRALESKIHPPAKPVPPKRPAVIEPPPRIQVVQRQDLARSLKTQPIQTAREIREPAATVVRVHPAYDRIVQRLLTYRRTQRQSVVLVTSAIAGEGTSTVARNVATALSQAGTEQILLIDANLRNPSQHGAFHLKRAEGFSEVLKGELSLTAAIHDDVGSGISVMASGSPVKSPSQVLKASAVQGTMIALLSLYDWIVLDTPPATAYPDVASLGTACGVAILVIQAESTRFEVVEEAKTVLDGTGVEILGAVLNRRRFHIPRAIYERL